MAKTFSSWTGTASNLFKDEHPVNWIERAFEQDVQQLLLGLHNGRANLLEVQREAQALHDRAEKDAYWQGYTDAGLVTTEQIKAISKHPYLVTHGSRIFAQAYLSGLIAACGEEADKIDEDIVNAKHVLAVRAAAALLVLAVIGLLVWWMRT